MFSWWEVWYFLPINFGLVHVICFGWWNVSRHNESKGLPRAFMVWLTLILTNDPLWEKHPPASLQLAALSLSLIPESIDTLKQSNFCQFMDPLSKAHLPQVTCRIVIISISAYCCMPLSLGWYIMEHYCGNSWLMHQQKHPNCCRH